MRSNSWRASRVPPDVRPPRFQPVRPSGAEHGVTILRGHRGLQCYASSRATSSEKPESPRRPSVLTPPPAPGIGSNHAAISTRSAIEQRSHRHVSDPNRPQPSGSPGRGPELDSNGVLLRGLRGGVQYSLEAKQCDHRNRSRRWLAVRSACRLPLARCEGDDSRAREVP